MNTEKIKGNFFVLSLKALEEELDICLWLVKLEKKESIGF